MYRYYVNKRAPVALWMLDDDTPFFEYSGSGHTAIASGTTPTPTKSVPLVAGAAYSSVFKNGTHGRFDNNLFKTGREEQPFAIEAWILPIPKTTTGDQKILSHGGSRNDGLTVNGKVVRFGTSYVSTGDAFCDFDLEEYRAAHVVGVHTPTTNQLWVNGEQVASVQITDDQQADTYDTTSDYLYSGATTSDQEIAMNGVAMYPSLSGEQIMLNYKAGIATLGQNSVFTQYGGSPIYLNAGDGSVFFEEVWTDKADFERGLKDNVEYAPDQIEPVYEDGLSTVGSWTTAVPLDVQGDTSIYGVMVAYTAHNATVEVSLDGVAWSPTNSGELVSIIPNGFDPTGSDLQIRVSFAAGVTEAYLESLRAVGFRDNEVNTDMNRTVTVSHPAVLRGNYEPILYRDDNGVSLNNGTLTISPDTSTDPQEAWALEMWVKILSGVIATNFTGTSYRNGEAYTAPPVGEWTLIHINNGAAFAGDITISGDLIVGQVALYPQDIDAGSVYKSYTGGQVQRFVDSQVTGLSEGVEPTKIYAHDWSIDAGG